MQHNNMFKQEDFVAGFLWGWGIVFFFFVGFAKRTFSVSVPVAVPAASPAPASVGKLLYFKPFNWIHFESKLGEETSKQCKCFPVVIAATETTAQLAQIINSSK